MRLKDLFSGIEDINLQPYHLDLNIQGVSVDPYLCKPGFLYLACTHETVDSNQLGLRLDGRDFINIATQNGAHVILTTQGVSIDAPNVHALYHEDPLYYLGLFYKRFYNASYPKHMVLVTGTDGKTSTVNFLKQLWYLMGFKSCSIGNLGAITDDGSVFWPPDFKLSVPDTKTLHEVLMKLASQNIDYVASEATSHALYEHRLTHIPVEVGVFTNLTKEHLDFHQTLEAYFQAKMRLFEEVIQPGGYAVINSDSPYSSRVKQICLKREHNIISVGFHGKSITLLSCTSNLYGQEVKIKVGKKDYVFQFNLHGQFQAYNLTSSLGVMMALGFHIDDLIDNISHITEVEGRFNTIGFTASGGRVVIDFAHTINGLSQAIKAAREISSNKVYVIHGAYSSTNLSLIKKMASTINKLADQFIITDAHATTLSRDELRKFYLEAAPNAIEIPGRANAIETICPILQKGDVLLITGMGNETFQWLGREKIPHSDKECVLHILKNMVGD